jgi:DNA-binding NarL/FixJ family response regulator
MSAPISDPGTSATCVRAAVRVIVLADVRLYREGLARILAAHETLSVVGAETIHEALPARIAAAQPDVLLIEARAACETEVVQKLGELLPNAKIVAYGVCEPSQQPLRCAELGVAAFVMGDATGEDLVNTILDVVRGEFRCPPHVAAMLLKRVSDLAQCVKEDAQQAKLTRRERGILTLVEQGCSNKQIASHLGIELSTVKNHVHHILEKLKAPGRAQAGMQFRHLQLESTGAAPARSRT